MTTRGADTVTIPILQAGLVSCRKVTQQEAAQLGLQPRHECSSHTPARNRGGQNHPRGRGLLRTVPCVSHLFSAPTRAAPRSCDPKGSRTRLQMQEGHILPPPAPSTRTRGPPGPSAHSASMHSCCRARPDLSLFIFKMTGAGPK